MTGRSQWMLVGGVVLVLAGLLGIATISSSGAGVVGPGAPAPEFTAQTVPDSGVVPVTRTLAAYRGRPVLLNLWATWCAPCRDEMPRIERLHRELAPAGLAVVAVSIDNPGMADAIREFRRELGLTFDILYDESGHIRDAYQSTGVPETFLIDRQGIVRRRLIGSSWTADDQLPLLRDMIAEPAR